MSVDEFILKLKELGFTRVSYGLATFSCKSYILQTFVRGSRILVSIDDKGYCNMGFKGMGVLSYDLSYILNMATSIINEEIDNIGEVNVNKTSDKVSVEEKEMVNNPEHYGKGTYEAINVIEAWGANFNIGNSLKYLSRYGKKDPNAIIQDLEKARWYIDREVSNLKKAQK